MSIFYEIEFAKYILPYPEELEESIEMMRDFIQKQNKIVNDM